MQSIQHSCMMMKLSGYTAVSVIIPTFNSERFLESCLSSIKNQDIPNLEIIMVDDGSTDSTLEIAKRFGCKVFSNTKKGRSEAKNLGIEKARGEFLFFADSDMEFTRGVLSECVKLMCGIEGVGGIVVPERSIGDNFWVKVRNFERSFYVGSKVESARFFRAEVAKKAGGFEESVVFFEESTLPFKIEKLGYCVYVRSESLVLHHEEDFSLKKWLRKKFLYGKTIGIYKGKYGDFFVDQMGFSSRLRLFLKKRFFSRPLLAFGVLFLKSQEYFVIRLGSAVKSR